MSKRRAQQTFDPGRLIRKFFLSGFVVFSFVAYALHKPETNTDVGFSVVSPTPSLMAPAQVLISTLPDLFASTAAPQQLVTPTSQEPVDSTQAPPPAILLTPAPTVVPGAPPSHVYKDGTYTGPEVDAFYGLVQVKTVIQNGNIVDVQFVEYPSDRRTSVRINSIAMPYLQQEAIRAQNANVDIITGATLTSQGFIMSLQAALDQARG